MNRHRYQIKHLFSLARRASHEGVVSGVEASPAAVARIARIALSELRGPHLADVFERLCWWGATAAAAACLVAAVLRPATPDALDLFLQVPVAEDSSRFEL